MNTRSLLTIVLTIFLYFPLNAIGTRSSLNTKNTCSPNSILQQVSDNFSQVAENSIPAVVSIKAFFEPSQFNDPQFNDFFHHFFGPMPQEAEPAVGYGSGFFITEDGYILTNNHVVKDAKNLKVSLQDGSEHDAEIIGSDPSTEVALIRIKGNNFPFLTLANSDNVKVGQWAIAIGNPFEFESSVTVGIISAKGRRTNGTSWENYLQTDAPINPGNSGGPLLNIYGEVVGINTAIISKSGGYMGIGFAIPSNMAEHVADQLYKHGHTIRGYLGVYAQNLTPDLAEALNVDTYHGFVIVEVAPASPAEKAGFKSQDVILKLNGKSFTSKTNLTHEISLINPGTKVKFMVNRDGKVKEIVATIGQHPTDFSNTNPSTVQNMLGIEVENLTDIYSKRLGYNNLSGVIVTKVDPRSKMAMAYVKPGSLIMSVNRQKVSNVDEFYAALADATQNNHVLLLVRYGKISRYITINMK